MVSYTIWLPPECDGQPYQSRQQIDYAACISTAALFYLIQSFRRNVSLMLAPAAARNLRPLRSYIKQLIGCHSSADAWRVPVLEWVQALHAAAAERSLILDELTSLSPRVLDIARPPGHTLRGPTGRPSTALELSSRPSSFRRFCSALLSSNL